MSSKHCVFITIITTYLFYLIDLLNKLVCVNEVWINLVCFNNAHIDTHTSLIVKMALIKKDFLNICCVLYTASRQYARIKEKTMLITY